MCHNVYVCTCTYGACEYVILCVYCIILTKNISSRTCFCLTEVHLFCAANWTEGLNWPAVRRGWHRQGWEDKLVRIPQAPKNCQHELPPSPQSIRHSESSAIVDVKVTTKAIVQRLKRVRILYVYNTILDRGYLLNEVLEILSPISLCVSYEFCSFWETSDTD